MIAAWRTIERALEDVLGPLPPSIDLGEGASTRTLKAYEDMLDGIVCAGTAAPLPRGAREAAGRRRCSDLGAGVRVANPLATTDAAMAYLESYMGG